MTPKPHPDLKELLALFPYVRRYQELAVKHGIPDIFQDNGGKILQVCLALGLRVVKDRMGNDAIGPDGLEYELKTVNTLRTHNFTTHHHMNPIIIAKYRKVSWIFSTYEAIELKNIWLLTPAEMEPCYQLWEAQLRARNMDHLNNPKIPLRYVATHGRLLWSSSLI